MTIYAWSNLESGVHRLRGEVKGQLLNFSAAAMGSVLKVFLVAAVTNRHFEPYSVLSFLAKPAEFLHRCIISLSHRRRQRESTMEPHRRPGPLFRSTSNEDVSGAGPAGKEEKSGPDARALSHGT
jgi:hypothetical protein